MSFRTESNNLLIIIMLIFMVSAIGCQNYEYWSKACDDCLIDEPSEGELTLKFLLDDENKSVAFRVYEGEIETGNLIIEDTALVNSVTFTMPSEIKYSAEAFYHKDGKTIVVVDGDKIRTQTTSCPDENDPESTHSCWYVVPAFLNLELLKDDH
jgi:hypothetical protein